MNKTQVATIPEGLYKIVIYSMKRSGKVLGIEFFSTDNKIVCVGNVPDEFNENSQVRVV